MVNFRNEPVRGRVPSHVSERDEGLRGYMLRVYGYMALGLLLSGLCAAFAYALSFTSDVGQAYVENGVPLRLLDSVYVTQVGWWLYVGPTAFVVMLAPLAVVFFLSARVRSISAETAQLLFWFYAALVGVSIAVLVSHEAAPKAFFMAASGFGALTLFGYTTSRDLSPFGSFLFMGLVGILIASVVNLFLASPAFHFVLSALGVLLFAGLTAYDTQRIKEMYYEGDRGDVMQRKAVMGALSLYLDFLNLFLFLLQLMRRQ